ncbi:MAG: ShlB/FhaC/HecB family hemolysin secretion/activation protein [Thermosynechococcaceae cyanobacterium]
MLKWRSPLILGGVVLAIAPWLASTVQSQTAPGPLPNPIFPAPPTRPAPPLLPPPEQLLQPPTAPPLPPSELRAIPGNISVGQFEVVGSTVFTPTQLAAITDPYLNKPLTFAELLQVASAITQQYIDAGYITSGAFIPANQTFAKSGGTVRIQVLEGILETIQVNGTGRLNSDYVRDRLRRAAAPPLNVDRLVEALQLLQLDPLFKDISAELANGSQPGTSLLTVQAPLAKTFRAEAIIDNAQSPSVGSFRRGIHLSEANLGGQGDRLDVSYFNTDGSHAVAATYTYPINALNGTLSLSVQPQWNKIVEKPSDSLKIRGKSRDFSLTYRQPIVQTPSQEFALGLTLTRKDSQNFLFGRPFPISPDADNRGRTRLSILRFSQDYLQRSASQVFSARSQFSLGLNLFDATINRKPPDGRFLTWLGQAQWVRQFAPDTSLLVSADVQWANRPLTALEQFSIGGPETVRGYRQNLLLANSGAIATAEARLPILRLRSINGLLQVVPFIDVGHSFDGLKKEERIPQTLASVGLGLRLQIGSFATMRFDYGFPLIPIRKGGDSLQEQGFNFSLVVGQSF